MSYRKFDDGTTLTDARDALVYTLEALDAHPDNAIKPLVKALTAGLARLDALDLTRQTLKRQVIRANAHVRTWDAVGEDFIRDLSKDVLGATRQDRTAPLYLAFFPEAPSALMALSLDPQTEALERMQAALASDETPADLRKAYRQRLDTLVEKSNTALDHRKKALIAQAEGEADVRRAIELVDRTRRAALGALTTLAAEQDKPADFPDRFFPAPIRQRGKKGTPDDSDPTE